MPRRLFCFRREESRRVCGALDRHHRVVDALKAPEVGRRKSDVRKTSKAEHPTSNAEHRTQNAERNSEVRDRRSDPESRIKNHESGHRESSTGSPFRVQRAEPGIAVGVPADSENRDLNSRDRGALQLLRLFDRDFVEGLNVRIIGGIQVRVGSSELAVLWEVRAHRTILITECERTGQNVRAVGNRRKAECH